MGLALLNSCSLHELSEIRRLIDAALDYIRRVVRLYIDVLWEVVRFSVRVIRSICKVEGDVEVVHDF